jgi:hypothetical protein
MLRQTSLKKQPDVGETKLVEPNALLYCPEANQIA